ncbi:methyltransferase [Aurantiacibacter sp. MUD11]|uniref:methyltransferase n=1 Tax=Aurantiacibacter sp. MUD11 TaxID=3003265 RepID=UPI0022AAECEE|nr:methyltransferase [Aurantiacibacter sp. MUD11]WAT17441.1 methyltransferase [Aurantiacibacter sp. MUD11]
MSAAQDDLRNLIAGYWKPHMAIAAARLGVADAMDDSGCQAAGLAAAIGADAEALARFLRALASIGLVRDLGDDSFALTPMGERLRADHPESLKGMALHVGTQLSPAFAELHECVTKGKPPAHIKYGPEGFAGLDEDAEAAAVFNQAMVDNSRRFAAQAAELYDFARFASIMDVGGGYGAVLATLLQAAPQARGCVLDMAHARDGAEAYFAREGVADRARFVTASFFEPLPETADCYVLKYILHDWAEEPARQIVQRVGEAARASGGTVVVIEKVMPEKVEADPGHAVALYGDMTMMLWDGRERTRSQFAELLAHGGLALTRMVELSDNHHLLEAVPT